MIIRPDSDLMPLWLLEPPGAVPPPRNAFIMPIVGHESIHDPMGLRFSSICKLSGELELFPGGIKCAVGRLGGCGTNVAHKLVIVHEIAE